MPLALLSTRAWRRMESEGMAPPVLNLMAGWRWVAVSGALSVEERPLVSFDRKLCGRDDEETNLHACPRCNAGSPPHSLIAMLTELSRIPVFEGTFPVFAWSAWPSGFVAHRGFRAGRNDKAISVTRRSRCCRYGWGSCREQRLPVPFARLPHPLVTKERHLPVRWVMPTRFVALFGERPCEYLLLLLCDVFVHVM